MLVYINKERGQIRQIGRDLPAEVHFSTFVGINKFLGVLEQLLAAAKTLSCLALTRFDNHYLKYAYRSIASTKKTR